MKKNIEAIIENERKQAEEYKRIKRHYKTLTPKGTKPSRKKLSKAQTEKKLSRKARKLKNRQKRQDKGTVNPYRYYSLYALLLEDNNYYVGMTSYKDVRRRFHEHAESGQRSAMWTRLHKPIDIIETRYVGYMRQSECAELEDRMTIEYMDKYGIEVVRGGCMCSLSISIVKMRRNTVLKPKVTKVV